MFDEDGLPGGLLGGIGDLDPDRNGPISAAGMLAHSYGSDGAGQTLLLGRRRPCGLYLHAERRPHRSDGQPVPERRQRRRHSDLARNTTDGAYTVTQLHAIDHPPGSNENDQLLRSAIRSRTQRRHRDGTLSLSVDDDSPVVAANAPIVFDEDALPFGNLGGIGDLDPATNGPITATGTLAHNYGADGAGTSC